MQVNKWIEYLPENVKFKFIINEYDTDGNIRHRCYKDNPNDLNMRYKNYMLKKYYLREANVTNKILTLTLEVELYESW